MWFYTSRLLRLLCENTHLVNVFFVCRGLEVISHDALPFPGPVRDVAIAAIDERK